LGNNIKVLIIFRTTRPKIFGRVHGFTPPISSLKRYLHMLVRIKNSALHMIQIFIRFRTNLLYSKIFSYILYMLKNKHKIALCFTSQCIDVLAVDKYVDQIFNKWLIIQIFTNNLIGQIFISNNILWPNCSCVNFYQLIDCTNFYQQ
jgi:hypothetical protein